MRHKTLDEIIKTLHEVEQELTGMIDEDMTLTEAWIPIEDFDSDHVGLCWIAYKRRTIMARREARSGSYFYGGLRSAGYYYMTECITHVMPLPEPTPPNGK